MHRNGGCAIGVLGVLLEVAVPLGAQDHPAVERGFAAETLYQFADLDTVNLLNGAVSVRIPVGGAYPAGGSLSYQLNLVYSSKLWDFEEVIAQSGYLVRSLPARHTTAGFGWTLSLGRLLPPTDPANETGRWQYLDPMGGRHGLYSTLHPFDAVDTGVSYTRDSTYLRMTEVAGGNRTLEFPDGQIHTFNGGGRLTKIEDRFGNYLAVAYPNTSTWTLSDGTRTHTVSFQAMVSDGQPVMVVDKVELAAFDGAIATYDFTYESTMVAPAHTDTFHSPTAKIEVPLLTRVDLPDGSAFVPEYYLVNYSYGLLESLTLPTLGQIAYDWAFWNLPTEGCSDNYKLKLAYGPPFHRYTLRDLSGQVLREYTAVGDFWTAERDYIYRGGRLLAAATPAGVRHFHLDHLGTPRLITTAGGQWVAYHAYYPFGEEATNAFQDEERLKFTGHERDLADLSGTGDDLDYMHARHCSPLMGRFMSVDPKVSLKRAMRRPHSWNRYSYVANNPMKYVDPKGEVYVLGSCASGDQDLCNQDIDLLKSSLGENADQIRVNVDGSVSLAKGVSASTFAAGGDYQKGLLMLIGAKGTFTLVTDSGKGAAAGGGKFEPDGRGGGSIFLETSMLPSRTGDVISTAETALVHETGHALEELFPAFYQSTNAHFLRSTREYLFLAIRGEGYAVNFEDRYRQANGLDIRYVYNDYSPDILVDFSVGLFPPE